MSAPSCPTHADLVARATGPEPSDDDLERYAHEVPDCPQCRRALAVALQVHPTVLTQGGHRPVQAAWAATGPQRQSGNRGLYAAVHAPTPVGRGLRLAAGLAAAAVLLPLLTWPVWRSDLPEPGSDGLAVIEAPRRPTVPLAELPHPTPVAVVPLLAPVVDVQRIVEAASIATATAPAELDDAVAMLDDAPDWPPPPLEDLRRGQAKGPGGDIDVALLLSGASRRHVQDAVSLTVVTQRATPLAVCVTGPEAGVIWRGWVNAGRTELSRDGRLQSFAFAEPGIYVFTTAVGDLERCSDPSDRVTVDVRP